MHELWYTLSDAGPPSLFRFSSSKEVKKKYCHLPTLLHKISKSFLRSSPTVHSTASLCKAHTQPCTHSCQLPAATAWTKSLLAPNSLQNTSRNISHCAIINTGHKSMWENNTTVLQICLTHSSTPVQNIQINSLQHTEVHDCPPWVKSSSVKSTWLSHPFYFLHAQTQSCPTRRMLIMAALKHQSFPIFISLNQGWITGNTKSPCHRNLFCFG